MAASLELHIPHLCMSSWHSTVYISVVVRNLAMAAHRSSCRRNMAASLELHTPVLCTSNAELCKAIMHCFEKEHTLSLVRILGINCTHRRRSMAASLELHIPVMPLHNVHILDHCYGVFVVHRRRSMAASLELHIPLEAATNKEDVAAYKEREAKRQRLKEEQVRLCS
jgi:hypothetical protein